MLVYRQASNLFIVILMACSLVSPIESRGENVSKVSIYSYEEKRNVELEKVIQEEGHRFLLVDENCSVCESLLNTIKPWSNSGIVLTVINEPSFKWRARMKRHQFKNRVYNINSLNIDFSEGTPQLFELNDEGKLVSKVYGRSKILNIFNN